jgi:hypothetical protein
MKLRNTRHVIYGDKRVIDIAVVELIVQSCTISLKGACCVQIAKCNKIGVTASTKFLGLESNCIERILDALYALELVITSGSILLNDKKNEHR